MRVLLASFLLLSACYATVTSTAVNPSPTAMVQRKPEQVELFTSGPPQRPHTDVALLEAEPGGLDERTTEALVARMREQAAEQGCDGLVITDVSTQAFRSGERKTVVGTCIVYTR